MIERDLTEPDRIAGELLQPGGYLKLIELGLDGKFYMQVCCIRNFGLMDLIGVSFVHACVNADCLSDIDAQPVFGYALYKNGKETKISYPNHKLHPNVSGMSFRNGRFVQRMREKASTLPKYPSFIIFHNF